MNPSANGWIDKLNALVYQQEPLSTLSEEDFYLKLRASGFVYGSNLQTAIEIPTELKLSEDEITKVNLLSCLLFYYQKYHPQQPEEEAVKEILNFYKELKATKFSFLEKILIGKECSAQLEKVIDSRIRLNSNIITQNFSNLITNALLFSDVLAFIHFMKKKKGTERYAIKLENQINKVVYEALNSKASKSEHDELLIKLVASSLRYHKGDVDPSEPLEDVVENYHTGSDMGNRYLIDLACLVVWDDATIDHSEENFLDKLGHELGIAPNVIADSLKHIQLFIGEHREEIAFFNTANPVKTFYDQSSKVVSKLILRNQKRLLKELNESGELLVLLTRSTVKDLTDDEKQKVKAQLLDICKSIPSLAIFALPGGGLLLPLLVKFIPKLLPSAFDDNKLPEE
ncbi:LETM1-related biofilm-associated protein [Flavobacteriaceae bacterium M23B6Z8]